MSIQIPGYTIIRKIGHGGSAEVFLAVQENLNRRVALKLVKGSLTSDPNFGERFKREGRIIAQLSHPHIVPVYDVGVHNDNLYMAMEYLSQGDLTSRASELTLNDLLTVTLQITQALQVAHERGFIHRDIKPANILFRNAKEAVLTDFGIARQTESLTQMTVTGAMLGTPAYMSPEQIAGKELDSRADLYSLGITLFELLTGYQPYRSDSLMNVAMQQVNADIPRLPKVSSSLQGLIDKLLAKSPENRIANASALCDELKEIISLPEKLSTPLTSLWPEKAPEINHDINFNSKSINPVQEKSLFGKGIVLASISILLIAISWYFYSNKTADIEIPDLASNSPSTIDNENSAAEPWQGILAEANRLFEEKQLVHPENDNALALFRSVLEQDPANSIAQDGDEKILRQLSLEVEQLIFSESLQEAQQEINALRKLWPEEQQVQQLQSRLEQTQQRIDEQDIATTEAKRRREINEHLQNATAALLGRRYLRPESDNALSYFQKVGELEPENETVSRGMRQISDALLSDIQTSINTKDFSLADSLLADLRVVNPDHPEWESTSNSIVKARAAYQQQQEQQRNQLELQSTIERLVARQARWENSTEQLEDQFQLGQKLHSDIAQLLGQNTGNLQLQNLNSIVGAKIKEIEKLQNEKKKRKPPAIGVF